MQSWRRVKKEKEFRDQYSDTAAAILTYCFYLIILDIIENNVTFVLPVISRKASIFVKPITGETFEYLYREGSFNGLDFLKTNFVGYRLCYQYQTKESVREKPIYIDKTLKKRLYDNANNGMVYY
ncbi:MAG: hypothetical protein J6V44_12120 [Methanobrevibacter sp.]|nr:hypothetical protein [Methanobrevibacter sp.]